MRTINEPLLELEDIINYNLEAIHKLAQIANVQCKDNAEEQKSIAKAVGCLWNYLRPVHKWIREQNQNNTTFYDELDKYLEEEAKRSTEVKIEAEKPKVKKVNK